MSVIPLISQLKLLWPAVTDETAGTGRRQTFLGEWEKHSKRQIFEMTDHNVPTIEHVKERPGSYDPYFACIGRRRIQSGVMLPILAGVTDAVTTDATIIGTESSQHRQYDSRVDLGEVSRYESTWRGAVVDVAALAVGNVVLSADDSFMRMEHEEASLKVFRIEGENIFLTKQGMLRHSTNGHIFSGIGGNIVKYPGIVKLISPPVDESMPVIFKQAQFYFSSRNASHAKDYYEQRLLEYRDAVKDLRSSYNASAASHPAIRSFQIKSFRVFTNDAERMFRYVPRSGNPSPTGIRRIDITKTPSGCSQPVYIPLIQETVPCTYGEPDNPWFAHLPTRLRTHMWDYQVAHGHVRTFVITESKFKRSSLKPTIADAITDQELGRLEHGPISLAALSEEGIESIEVRQEAVRRVRQSREVKCGREIIGDVDHGRHMEYLAEFSDGSTSWIPSCNVAADLKEELWNVMTTDAKEVTGILDSDVITSTVLVKRPWNIADWVKKTQIFWKLEAPQPTNMTDAELEAVLHYAHFGIGLSDFIPCTVLIKTDWARVEIITSGAVIMKDPAADKAGEYAGVQIKARSIFFGKQHSSKYASRSISFIIANNGALFDIRVTHGADANGFQDHKGKVILKFRDEQLESAVDKSNLELNPSTFRIRPVIVTPALLIIKSDWGAIEILSKDATIGPDPTVDQTVYKQVKFSTTRSMKQHSGGVFGKEFVVPFLLFTRDEWVDVAITHGADYNIRDGLGAASAIFAQNTYKSGLDRGNLDTSYKTFMCCPVNKRPPVIAL